MRLMTQGIDFNWSIGIAVRAGNRRNGVILLRRWRGGPVPFKRRAKAVMALRAWIKESKTKRAAAPRAARHIERRT
jgi:hypothetical protein